MSTLSHPPEQDPMTVSEPIHVDRLEGIWIRVSLFVLVIFAILIIYSGTSMGIHLPGVHGRVDPRTIATPGNSPFADPQVTELAPLEYAAYIRAQIWAFTPNEIRVPVGSKITFYVTSQDVQHGFHIDRTNVNVMVLPGQITKVATRFDEAGVYNFVCHEYCGLGHHTMFGRIIVEDEAMIAAAATATAQAAVPTPAPAAAQAQPALPAGDAARGQQNFTACAACHGPHGEGVTGLGKSLVTSEFVTGKSDAELVDFLKVGRAVGDPLNTTGIAMPPKGGNPALSDSDLLDIVAYIRTLQP